MRGFLLVSVLGSAAICLAAPSRAPEEPATIAPDLLFFEKNLAAELHQRCATCHSDPEQAARFPLEPLPDLDRPDRAIVLRNFRSVLRFLEPEDPASSPLLRRALGMDGHPGGAVYASLMSRDFQPLLQFALGATVGNRAPEAILAKRLRGVAGEDAQLDGTLSGDPDGSTLTYRWSLRERPPGSAAELPADAGAKARVRPDREGVYRIELRVGDGTLWSLPASTLLVVEAPPETPEPPDMSAPREKRPLVDRRLDPRRLHQIRRLYLDLKWRSPKLEEVENWYERSHAEMVDAFLADEETWSAWFEQQLYYFLLLDQFRPKEGRLTTLAARLASGEIEAPRALEEIVRSQYFNARNPGNDTFVTVVLEQCLGMVVQERANKIVLETGKKMYDGYPVTLFREKGDSQADLIRIVVAQRDFSRLFLRRMWKDLHGSEIDPKRLEAEAAALDESGGAYRKLLRGWLTGAAYIDGCDQARTKPEIPYVRALFVDTLGRTPAYEEMRNVRNAFLSLADPTPIRLVMGRVLLESAEASVPASAIDPERFVKEQFVRLFARLPDSRETAAFATALKEDPRVTPRVVLWTLISSPEYQSY